MASMSQLSIRSIITRHHGGKHSLDQEVFLERFQDKWIRLSGSKTRPNKDLEAGFDSIKTEKALDGVPELIFL
jgi:hypothetical protein